jgi:hypothetical protein
VQHHGEVGVILVGGMLIRASCGQELRGFCWLGAQAPWAVGLILVGFMASWATGGYVRLVSRHPR